MPDSLRSAAELERSIRNFDIWLGDVVSGGMDVDFLCERNGSFLFVEGKPWQNGIVVNFGQHLTLERLSQQPSTTVLLVGEHRDDFYLFDVGSRAPNIRRVRGRLAAFYWPKMFTATDVEGLRSYVERWWCDCST